jgi:hypothetical protein
MTRITIYTDNTISVGTTITGYCVRQSREATVVVKWHNNGHPPPREMGDVVNLPRSRYDLNSTPGLAEFEVDFLVAWDAALV